MPITVRPPTDRRSAQEAMDIYHNHAERTLGEIEHRVLGSGWDMLDLEDQGEIMDGVTRLYGHDPFTSAAIRRTIERESVHHWELADLI